MHPTNRRIPDVMVCPHIATFISHLLADVIKPEAKAEVKTENV
jgi:hypothetical protein